MAVDQIRVLLVEDNRGDARLVERRLAGQSSPRFEIQVADRLRTGLRLLATDEFDVALLDLSLPDHPEPGVDILRQAREASPRTPIVVLTGCDDPELASELLRSGAQDYLLKDELDSGLLVRSLLYAIDRQRWDEALRESEERFALAVRGANDGLWDWNLVSETVFFSERWKSIVGLGADDIVDRQQHWLERIHPEDRERVERELHAHLEGLTPRFKSEYRILHADSSFRWVSSRGIAVTNGNGKVLRMAGSMSDITQRKLTEEELLHAALHDALTGLPNRAMFLDRLQIAIAQSKRRTDYIFAVLFLDLDRFKTINDSLGHAAGDRLLVSIARRLEAAIRPSDRVARLGGDEFAILADGIEDLGDSTRIANRLLCELAVPYELDGHAVYSSASIGIATSVTGYDRADDLIRDADNAMYRAKSLGKSRYQLFDPEMHARAMALLELETDLRRAIDQDELCVYYQPIIDLENGAIEGFEALVRWNHPTRGLIFPGEFVPLAEETGLILNIGRWVLADSCRQMAMWQRRFPSEHPLTLSVNVSSRELVQRDLVQEIAGVLAQSAIVHGSLRLEITESAIMDNPDEAIAKLRKLKDLAVQLHLDDFGTGYSSLSYLHRLPTDTLKIDRSFVHELREGGQGGEIIGTIVALARKLGIRVSAEGIETSEQMRSVRDLACDFGQGFFFSAAVEPGAAERLLSAGSMQVH